MARVLDLTRQAAVYATRLLAEQGHEVIRVEAPAGDAVRRLGPFLGDVRIWRTARTISSSTPVSAAWRST